MPGHGAFHQVGSNAPAAPVLAPLRVFDDRPPKVHEAAIGVRVLIAGRRPSGQCVSDGRVQARVESAQLLRARCGLGILQGHPAHNE